MERNKAAAKHVAWPKARFRLASDRSLKVCYDRTLANLEGASIYAWLLISFFSFSVDNPMSAGTLVQLQRVAHLSGACESCCLNEILCDFCIIRWNTSQKVKVLCAK